jgi:hypothetical protein
MLPLHSGLCAGAGHIQQCGAICALFHLLKGFIDEMAGVQGICKGDIAIAAVFYPAEVWRINGYFRIHGQIAHPVAAGRVVQTQLSVHYFGLYVCKQVFTKKNFDPVHAVEPVYEVDALLRVDGIKGGSSLTSIRRSPMLVKQSHLLSSAQLANISSITARAICLTNFI